ncbi:hypothetical protein KAI04_00925 [Candidatus Pacearchaeota archaeon]|nr:hypothetical protein [Candidatus Pacearchaeota archaeon]
MSIFKSKEEKAEIRKKEDNMREISKQHNKRVKKIILWPGSIKEYENFVGYPVKVLDTQKPKKYVIKDKLYVDFEDLKYSPIKAEHKIDFVNNGLEALVRINNFKVNVPTMGTYSSPGGLPVAKK